MSVDHAEALAHAIVQTMQWAEGVAYKCSLILCAGMLLAAIVHAGIVKGKE